MRLHHLSMTAFGPFPGTEQIDFTDLNDAGLFLLTGPTGAGKTSVLDAICFALFGSVPGARGVKALRSDHADPQVRPEVVLDFSVRDRRFVLRRTPEWTRPKRRGAGSTTEKASATLLETTSGSEHLLSSRAQEIGHFVGDLVGMSVGQFVQVAMLPQGEFQQFLRASSQERHDVLQHLFRTDRFTRIEEWVHDHSRRLGETAGHGEEEVRRILHTIAHRSGTELPEQLQSLPRAAADGLVLPFAAEALEDALRRRATTTAESDVATTALAEARTAVQRGERSAAALSRRTEALRQLAELEESADEESAARNALAADERATRCTAVLDLVETTARHVADVERRTRAALELTGEEALLDKLDTDAFEARDRALSSQIARLEALLPREAVLLGARREIAALDVERDGRLAARDDLVARAAALPGELVALRSRLVSARQTGGRREALELALQRAGETAAAAARLPAAEAELTGARDHARQARDQAADAREHLHDLVARRLAGMAAELAGRLTDGSPCQVCGSTAHPHPAPPAEDPVTAEEQQRASDAYDEASGRHTAAVRRVTEAEQRLEALQAVAGELEPDAAALEVDRLGAELTAARSAEQLSEELAAEEGALLAEQEQVTTELHRVDTTLTALDVRLERLRRDVAEIVADVRAVTEVDDTAADDEPPTVSDLISRLGEHRDRLRDAATARTEADEARARLRDVRDQALRSVTEHGFPDVEACRHAVLTPTQRERHDRLVAERAAARARAEATLEAPDVAELAGDETPNVAALQARLAEAEASAAAASKVRHQAEDVASTLEYQHRLLTEALERWAPAREEHSRASAMAKLVRGMGSDNQLQMRLSAYVLATRLDQVVDAANERLAQMRDQRYLLQRTGRATRRGSQAGLGLEVVDQWTGETREPTSLSGGETFVVSLSLALGLADVVTNEAGGTEVETLFVDEGFGSLDADTLDDVMDRLDGLRAGGRTVGVVSHVAEMRNRIPTQVHVDKRRTGSTIAVRTLVG